MGLSEVVETRLCHAWLLFLFSVSLVLEGLPELWVEPLLRCEDATTVPKGLVVLLATTLALVLPLRVVPFVALVDAGVVAADAVLLELLRFDDDDGGEDEDTETERKTRGKVVQSNQTTQKCKEIKMEPNIQIIVEN